MKIETFFRKHYLFVVEGHLLITHGVNWSTTIISKETWCSSHKRRGPTHHYSARCRQWSGALLCLYVLQGKDCFGKSYLNSLYHLKNWMVLPSLFIFLWFLIPAIIPCSSLIVVSTLLIPACPLCLTLMRLILQQSMFFWWHSMFSLLVFLATVVVFRFGRWCHGAFGPVREIHAFLLFLSLWY